MNEPRRTRSTTSHRLALGIAIVGTLGATLVIGCAPDNYKTPFSSWSAAEAKPEAEGAQAAPAEPGGDHEHRSPPPQAFDACKEKQAGDPCNVQMGENEIAGKCDPAPPGAVQGGLACRPEGEARRHRGPPPEIVFAVCNGKAAGDPCTVEHDSRTVNGACMMPRREGGGDRLLCAPAHPHRGGGGRGDGAMGNGPGLVPQDMKDGG